MIVDSNRKEEGIFEGYNRKLKGPKAQAFFSHRQQLEMTLFCLWGEFIVDYLFINSSCTLKAFVLNFWRYRFNKNVNICLPVSICGSKMSVLKLSNFVFHQL